MRFLSTAFVLLLSQVVQPQSAMVSGTVVKQGTGEPLSKATVTLSPGSEQARAYSVTTGGDGKFVFYNVTPGQYRISAERTNYLKAEFGDHSSNGCGRPVSLTAGQRMSDAQIVMIPAGVISGHLYDADHEGVPNVSAHALKYVYENGKRVFTVVQTVRTNDLGEYRLFGLAPGRYYVAAALETPSLLRAIQKVIETNANFLPDTPQPGGASKTIEVISRELPAIQEQLQGDRFSPSYFPGVVDPSAAHAIDLRPGENSAGVDITVALSHAVRITGKVVNASSREAPRGLSVELVSRLAHPGAGNPLRTSMVTDDGSFDIADVLPGSYFLIASGGDSSGRLAGRVLADVGDTNLQNVVIEVSRGFDLAGHITVDDPKVMERLIEVRLMSANPADAVAPSSDVVASINQPDGAFKLQGIMPGDYVPFLTFRVSRPEELVYAKALRLGSQDVRDGVRLDSQPAAQLEIVVGNNGAVVEGTVVNDKQEPVAGATIVLVPDIFLRKRFSLYKTRTTDASGRFRLDTISPGDYKVFAWEEVETGAWQDPDFLRAYETRGKALTLREGITAQAQISAIPSTGPIYGQCADPLVRVR